MMKLHLILADVDANDLLAGQKQFGETRLYEMLVTSGALFLAVVIAAIWAIMYSRKKRRHKHHHHHKPAGVAVEPGTATAAAAERESRRRKKWRRPRRPHRPLNPTLAQTGGLPPMRDENTPPRQMP